MPNSSRPQQRSLKIVLSTALVLVLGAVLVWALSVQKGIDDTTFSGELAKSWVDQQCAFGYRMTGSDTNYRTALLISNELKTLGWQVRFQEFEYMATTVRNILAWKGEGDAILLGAHYDTRREADAENSDIPVLGANDGASGVAVLLELARVINVEKTGKRLYFAFFDAEDNGRLDGWDWIVGSSYMAAHWGENDEQPLQQAIIIDMIGDNDLNVYWEINSDLDINRQIWQTANQLGYSDKFIPRTKYAIFDDHIPFIQMGVPAIDIIDFDYPYWHTTQDTPDKVSETSLEIVGKTLLTWLESDE